MSAFLAFPYADRVELLADGATCLPSGRLIAATDKIAAAPCVPLAITGRGRYRDIGAITADIIALSACGSVDDTLAALAGRLPDYRDNGGLEVVVAAYSETRGPVTFAFRSFDSDDWPAWSLRDFTGQLFGGGPEIAVTDVTAAGLDAATFAHGAAEGGLALMEIMRRTPGRDWTSQSSAEGYWIGGHVDHAVIDADGVRVARLLEWPDRVGFMIEGRPQIH